MSRDFVASLLARNGHSDDAITRHRNLIIASRLRGYRRHSRPLGSPGNSPSAKTRLSPQIRGLHHSAQSFAQIRRQRMPVVQPLWRHLKCCVRIEYNQVRIVARGNSTLAGWQPASRAGPSAIQRAISISVNPRRLASVHITASATERLEIPPHAVLKFPSSSLLHRRRTGRMIGGHQIDDSVPECLATRLRGFRGSGSAARTCTASHRQESLRRRDADSEGRFPRSPRSPSERAARNSGSARAAREMDDVQTKIIFPAQRQHHSNRRQLSFVGPRLQIGCVTISNRHRPDAPVAASIGPASSACTSSGRPVRAR